MTKSRLKGYIVACCRECLNRLYVSSLFYLEGGRGGRECGAGATAYLLFASFLSLSLAESEACELLVVVDVVLLLVAI